MENINTPLQHRSPGPVGLDRRIAIAKGVEISIRGVDSRDVILSADGETRLRKIIKNLQAKQQLSNAVQPGLIQMKMQYAELMDQIGVAQTADVSVLQKQCVSLAQEILFLEEDFED